VGTLVSLNLATDDFVALSGYEHVDLGDCTMTLTGGAHVEDRPSRETVPAGGLPR
jgi:hypothetical protein